MEGVCIYIVLAIVTVTKAIIIIMDLQTAGVCIILCMHGMHVNLTLELIVPWLMSDLETLTARIRNWCIKIKILSLIY